MTGSYIINIYFLWKNQNNAKLLIALMKIKALLIYYLRLLLIHTFSVWKVSNKALANFLMIFNSDQTLWIPKNKKCQINDCFMFTLCTPVPTWLWKIDASGSPNIWRLFTARKFRFRIVFAIFCGSFLPFSSF